MAMLCVYDYDPRKTVISMTPEAVASLIQDTEASPSWLSYWYRPTHPVELEPGLTQEMAFFLFLICLNGTNEA